MARTRIAIACQGGGSQCAFVAGALKRLLDQGIQHRYKIVGVSGTSGGAINAALTWAGLLQQARGDETPVGDRLIACWKDLSAQTPLEILFDRSSIEMLRLTEQGLLPSIATSPSSPQFRFMAQTMSAVIGRPEFTDLGALLTKHLDFGALPSLVEPDSPVLLIGAADVLEGTFKVFSSAKGEIKLESVLASAAIPNLFPAVWADGHAYWDGIFSANPPVAGFLRPALMGKGVLPEEIWILLINPARYRAVPERPSDIFDRRNQMAGNLSLRHELEQIEMVNLLLQEGALTDLFRARMGLDAIETIKVRILRMSEALAESLDYPSKLSRQPGHIARLIADGEAQASAFLATLDEPGAAPERASEAAAAERH
jgi:NTE family protein